MRRLTRFTIKKIDITFVIIPAIGDGSCMFHSILQAFNRTYIKSDRKDKQLICKKFRSDLGNVLSHQIKGQKIYDSLSRGGLSELSEVLPETSLINMRRSLNSNEWGDIRFLELISNMLELNIIVIDYSKKDIYITGDKELYIKKNRDTIFIANTDNCHFDTVGLEINGYIRTVFKYDESMISKLFKIP